MAKNKPLVWSSGDSRGKIDIALKNIKTFNFPGGKHVKHEPRLSIYVCAERSKKGSSKHVEKVLGTGILNIVSVLASPSMHQIDSRIRINYNKKKVGVVNVGVRFLPSKRFLPKRSSVHAEVRNTMNGLDRDGDAGLDSLELRIPPSYSMQTETTQALGEDEKLKGASRIHPPSVDEKNTKKPTDTTEKYRRYSTAYTVDTEGNMDSLFDDPNQDDKAQQVMDDESRDTADKKAKVLKQSTPPGSHLSPLLLCLSTRVHIDLLKRRFAKKMKYVKNTIAKDVDDLKELLDEVELNPTSPLLETFFNSEKHVQGDRHIVDPTNCNIPLCKAFHSDRAKFIAKSEAKEKRIIGVIHDFIEDDNALREAYEERLENDVFNPANQKSYLSSLRGVIMDKTILCIVATVIVAFVLSQAYLR